MPCTGCLAAAEATIEPPAERPGASLPHDSPLPPLNSEASAATLNLPALPTCPPLLLNPHCQRGARHHEPGRRSLHGRTELIIIYTGFYWAVFTLYFFAARGDLLYAAAMREATGHGGI